MRRKRSNHMRKSYRGLTSMSFVAGIIFTVALIAAGVFIWVKQGPRVYELTRDVPAYSILSATDVEAVHKAPAPMGATTEPSAVPGSMTVLPLKRHAVLLDNQVVKLPACGPSWMALITVPATPAMAGAPGQELMLDGVVEDSDAVERISSHAVLLSVQNGQAVLALAPDEAARATAFSTGKRHLMAIPVVAVPGNVNTRAPAETTATQSTATP
jgi:hypothetical protein